MDRRALPVHPENISMRGGGNVRSVGIRDSLSWLLVLFLYLHAFFDESLVVPIVVV